MSEPLISCIMVTHPAAARLQRLRTTLSDFAKQTHGRRELVVVIDAATESDAANILSAIADSGQDNIRSVVAGRPMTLGALRNFSWSHARGDVICTWDDDDRHHPTRLAEQYAAMATSGHPVCYLQEFMHYFVDDRRIYRVNFRPAPDPVAVNSLMCRADLALRYPETGPKAQLGEDEALFWEVRRSYTFHALADKPYLFIYVNHGANTCNDSHHRHLVEQMGASQALLRRYEASLRQGLSVFDFDIEGVTVAGRNGDAFVLDRSMS
jgi:glycosyltransferase involved in cell wall biosynthesis